MLKMKPEHIEHIRSSVAKFDTPFHRDRYKTAGLSDKRFHWDMLRAAGLMPWLCDTLYPYLNDAHIDSAMRHIVAPL